MDGKDRIARVLQVPKFKNQDTHKLDELEMEELVECLRLVVSSKEETKRVVQLKGLEAAIMVDLLDQVSVQPLKCRFWTFIIC